MPRDYGRKPGMGIAPPHPLPLDLIKRMIDWVVESMEGHEIDGKASPCWLWQGRLDDDGYPQVKWRGKKWQANRLAYVIFHGPLVDGEDVDHLCLNRSCINPAHLEAVDPYTNRVRRKNHRRNVVPI